jgi:hypothetical protein
MLLMGWMAVFDVNDLVTILSKPILVDFHIVESHTAESHVADFYLFKP